LKCDSRIISNINENQVVFEGSGRRSPFPILIGLFEASSIDKRVKKERDRGP
jgi:hypothetical protein